MLLIDVELQRYFFNKAIVLTWSEIQLKAANLLYEKAQQQHLIFTLFLFEFCTNPKWAHAWLFST